MICISLLTVVVYGITSSLIHHASTPSRQSYMLLLFRLIGFYVDENNKGIDVRDIQINELSLTRKIRLNKKETTYLIRGKFVPGIWRVTF